MALRCPRCAVTATDEAALRPPTHTAHTVSAESLLLQRASRRLLSRETCEEMLPLPVAYQPSACQAPLQCSRSLGRRAEDRQELAGSPVTPQSGAQEGNFSTRSQLSSLRVSTPPTHLAQNDWRETAPASSRAAPSLLPLPEAGPPFVLRTTPQKWKEQKVVLKSTRLWLTVF